MPYSDPVMAKTKQRGYAKKWRQNNRSEARQSNRNYYANPTNSTKIRKKKRAEHLMRKYGLTVEMWDVMAKRQNHKCLICGRKKPLVVDHCHETNVVIGLLCHFCNRWLGIYESWKAKGHFEIYLGMFQ